MDLNRRLERYDSSLPIERASTPPADWYTDPDWFELERETVFQENWVAVGRSNAVSMPRHYFTGVLAGSPFVAVRDDDGRLHAFHNVCRHHAARVVEGAGKTDRLSCPYHGWTYGLDGRLCSAPGVDGIADFSTEDVRLPSMAVSEWGPMVFLHPGSPSRSLADELEPLTVQLAALGHEELRFEARRTYRLPCNWKVFVDNYLDGGYHVRTLHKSLGAQLDLADYRTEVHSLFAVQSCASSKGSVEGGLDFAERIGERALYAWIYPNVMINRYGPIMDTNTLFPVSANETIVVFDYYFDASKADDAGFVKRALEASHRVQEEDIAICESVQAGLASKSFESGRYAPKLEAAEHHFHCLLAEDARKGLA